MISNWKWREQLLNDAISSDKIDFNMIESALREAKDAGVKEEVLVKG